MPCFAVCFFLVPYKVATLHKSGGGAFGGVAMVVDLFALRTHLQDEKLEEKEEEKRKKERK